MFEVSPKVRTTLESSTRIFNGGEMLSAFTKPQLPTAALGLEGDRVSLLSLAKTRRGEFSVERAAVAELPDGLIVPSFSACNISMPGELMGFLEDLSARAGLLRQRKWSVSLPANASRTAILTLDGEPSSKAELDEILDWKAEGSFGAPASALRLSLEKIAPDQQGKSRYLASAVMLEVLEEYEEVFAAMGWHAGMILPRAVSEAAWLSWSFRDSDSLLISSNWDGFTALLMRGDDPLLIRSVTCSPAEMDDEVFRLLMFYSDRLKSSASSVLDRVLVTGGGFEAPRIHAIASEALGRDLAILRADDMGLSLPGGGMTFNDLAAPSALASLSLR